MTLKPLYFFSLCFLFFGIHGARAQERVPADTTKKVEILAAKKLEFLKTNDTTELQILAGNVRLKQGSTLFYCDSCVINNRIHLLEAFGNVHINDADTANAYSDYLRYLTDKRVAYMQKNVRLTDGKATLTTNNLEYDVETKLGIYTNGGRMVNNKKSVLTSTEGYYYTDLKDIYFKKNVELIDPSYTLKSDSLLYNTESEVARFIAETFIKDSSNRTIKTKEGYYDTKNKRAEFGSRPVIQDGSTQIIAETVKFDDSTGISMAEGNAVVTDTAQQTVIIAGKIFRNTKDESILAFNKPLMIIKQEQDSVFITADTLFSARLSDLYRGGDSVKTLNAADSTEDVADSIQRNVADSIQKDTTENLKSLQKSPSGQILNSKSQTSNSKSQISPKESVRTNPKSDSKTDSTDRYLQAFYHVRIFSDSVQAVGDSMFYSFKDSVFRLYKEPVVWSKENQVTGDTILLFTKNKKADRFKVFENSFLVSKVQGDFFNQIKSSRMDGYLTDGSIDSVRARGLAECIYYIQNEDSSFTGVNQSSSDIMDIYFATDSTGGRALQRVVFRSAVKGTLWPMRAKTPEELRLQNFKWLDSRRPKTKYELYE
jgi:lipopolysaccharide export system protein LptA